MSVVGVIVPVFNAAPYLADLRESLGHQGDADLRIVCVDDGSTDGFLQFLQEWAAYDERVHVIAKENGGASTARNVGLDHLLDGTSNIDYVLFIDGDDFLLPNSISCLAQTAQAGNLDIVAFSAAPFYESETIHAAYKTYDDYYDRRADYGGKDDALSGIEYLSRAGKNDEFIASVCLQLFSATYLKRNGFRFKEGIIYEDNLFTFLITLSASRVAFLNENLYQRRVHGGSVMTSSIDWSNAWSYYCVASEEEKALFERGDIDKDQLANICRIIDSHYRLACDVLGNVERVEVARQLDMLDSQTFADFMLKVCGRRWLSDSAYQRGFNDAKAQIEKQVRSEFESSRSYRIGRALTALPRKLLGRG